jgi:uncharacterized protein (UPF0371 family)
MPRHPVVNRRNAKPLTRRSISASAEAFESVAQIAADLQVSDGSLIDTALREFIGRPHAEILDALAKHGHLTTDERDLIEQKHRSTT